MYKWQLFTLLNSRWAVWCWFWIWSWYEYQSGYPKGLKDYQITPILNQDYRWIIEPAGDWTDGSISGDSLSLEICSAGKESY